MHYLIREFKGPEVHKFDPFFSKIKNFIEKQYEKHYDYAPFSTLCFVVGNQSRGHIAIEYRTEDLVVARNEIVCDLLLC